jgi:CRP-like cAMP-binding protein
MQVLHVDPREAQYRQELMEFLNKFGLDAAAILSMARRAELVRYDPAEPILRQGQHDRFIYFLIEGNIRIHLHQDGEMRMLGERGPVTLLGEISYFNGTPATATVEPMEESAATLLRVAYPVFTEIIEEHPGVRTTLARIGDLRVISGYNGFTSYQFFMEQIGRKRDRFAVNRMLFPTLERIVRQVLLPRVEDHHRVLEVGDGPGIVSELVGEVRPALLPRLFLQATHLEEAITEPFVPQNSDLSRARYLRERFHHIIALQVFNVSPPDRIEEQFKMARKLLLPDGLLLIVKLNLLNLHYSTGTGDTRLLYQDLEDLMERAWPGMVDWRPLIQVTFLDADLDPLMEWNPVFCKAAKNLTIPRGLSQAERGMLKVVLDQARLNLFSPDEVHFYWLSWIANGQGFEMEAMEQEPEISFFYQLLRIT